LKVEKTHNYRKTRMMDLHKGGVEVQAISKLVGHKNIGTTFKYLEIGGEQALNSLKAYDKRRQQTTIAGSMSGSNFGSMSGSKRTGSDFGSMSGSKRTGSNFGSMSGSKRTGSNFGSIPGSNFGSIPGSNFGSIPGSNFGSMPGSKRTGSNFGSMPGSMFGSKQIQETPADQS